MSTKKDITKTKDTIDKMSKIEDLEATEDTLKKKMKNLQDEKKILEKDYEKLKIEAEKVNVKLNNLNGVEPFIKSARGNKNRVEALEKRNKGTGYVLFFRFCFFCDVFISRTNLKAHSIKVSNQIFGLKK